jgi:Ulp1 family protease
VTDLIDLIADDDSDNDKSDIESDDKEVHTETILNGKSVKDCVDIILNSKSYEIEQFIYENIVVKASFAVDNTDEVEKQLSLYKDNMGSKINSVGNIDIILSTLATLNTDTWLNDEILNSHMLMFSKFLPSKNYIIINTYFAEKVIDYNKNKKTPNYHENTIKRWLKKHYEPSGHINLKEYFEALEMIIFIRNISQVIIYFI